MCFFSGWRTQAKRTIYFLSSERMTATSRSWLRQWWSSWGVWWMACHSTPRPSPYPALHKSLCALDTLVTVQKWDKLQDSISYDGSYSTKPQFLSIAHYIPGALCLMSPTASKLSPYCKYVDLKKKNKLKEVGLRKCKKKKKKSSYFFF